MHFTLKKLQNAESPLTSPTTVVNNKSDAIWLGVDFQMFNQRIRQ